MAPSDTTTCRSPLIFTLKRPERMYVHVWATNWVSLCIEKASFFGSADSPLSCLTYFSNATQPDQRPWWGCLESASWVRRPWDAQQHLWERGAKTWESGGLSAAQTTHGHNAGWNIWKSVSSATESISLTLQSAQWDAFTPLGRWPFSNLRWPIAWNQQTTYCLSYLRLLGSSTFSLAMKTNKILVICSMSSPREGVRRAGGGGWVCVMSPSLTPASTAPPSPMASCVGGGRPPPAQCVCDPQVKVTSSDVQRNKHGGGVLFGWERRWKLSPRSLALGRNDVWRVGRVALCPGFFPRGDGDVSGVEKAFAEIKIVKAPLRIEVTLLSVI